jgi:tripartite-type tricarboxylate transporter receptor subunit TctC
MSWHKFFEFVALISVALLAALRADAQTWPDKPIRFIVAAPAGSSLDVLARAIADKLKGRLGQPIVVEDRPPQAAPQPRISSRSRRPTATRC